MTTSEFLTRLKTLPMLVTLSVLVFIVSFFLPVLDMGIIQLSGATAATRSFTWFIEGPEGALREIAAMSTAFGSESSWDDRTSSLREWWFKTAWVLNILFVGGIICSMVKRPNIIHIRILSSICVIWSLLGIFNYEAIILGMDNEQFSIGSFGLGYWAWITAFVLLLIGSFTFPTKSTKRSDSLLRDIANDVNARR